MAAGDSPSNPINIRTVSTDPAFSVGAIIAPAASCTDLATLVGSATKKVRVKRIIISGTQTTGGQAVFQIIKRTTANSGGTATQPTIVRNKTADGAPTAVLNAYTANPTLGTGATARVQRVPIGAATVTTNNVVCIDVDITLDGTAEALAVNLNGVTLAGGSIHVSFEWTEGE